MSQLFGAGTKAGLAALFAGLAATSGAGAQPATHADERTEARGGLVLEYDKKEPGGELARRERVNDWYRQTRGPLPTRRVIYGADDRIEVYEETDATLRAIAESAAVVVRTSSISDLGDGFYALSTSPWTSIGGTPLCPDEPFAGQPTVGFCSSFLVGSDLIVTAGHCVDGGDIGSVAFVFGFQINDPDDGAPAIVPADNVYFGTAIVNQSLGGEEDHSVVRLDRPVSGFNPVPIRRTGQVAPGEPLTVIGHPVALPKKIAGGAIVQAIPEPEWFQANLDTYGGNSGSMVVNLNTHVVEGILVRGAPDFVSTGGCVSSNEVPDSGNTGGGLPFEEVSITTIFADDVPPLGLVVNPAGAVLHYGAVGGPFTNSTVTYTLSNPTGDPVDYTVSLTDTTAGIEIDGGTSMLTGTLAGGASTDVAATVSADADLFAAGVYTADIVFNDVSNARSVTASHTVEVGQSVVSVSPADAFVFGGPVGGPFTTTKTYTITSERPTPSDVVVSGPSWLSFDGAAGQSFTLSSDGDFRDVVVGASADAASLPAGLYEGTIAVANQSSGATTEIPVAIDVGRRIYASSDTPITITDNETFSSTISVPDGFCVSDVDVEIDMTHTYSGDLIIELVSPAGTTVRLHDRSGGSDDFGPVRYDDDGGTLPDGPGALADYDLEVSTGDWTLVVSDNAGGDSGTLSSWTLRVAETPGGCPPATQPFALTVPSNGAASGQLAAVAPNNDPISYTITTLPDKGVLWDGQRNPILSVPYPLPDAQLTYRADIGTAGGDAFGWTAEAGGATSPEASGAVTTGERVTIAEFTLDTDPGWTREGAWAFGSPTGGGSFGGDPVGGFTGSNVFGYALDADYPNNLSPRRFLTTDPIDCSGFGAVELTFQRWLGIESSEYDHAGVDVSSDGSSWKNIWEHDSGSFSDSSWSQRTHDISAVADDQAAVQIRWGMGTTDVSITYPGWNIDDIVLTGLGSSLEPGDFNADGSRDFFDVSAFLAAFNDGDPLADMTGDGEIDFFDVSQFLQYFNAP